MSGVGLGRVKTQRRANCREKYPLGSPLWEREQHTELRSRGIGEAGSLPFARFHVLTQPGSFSDFGACGSEVCSTSMNGRRQAVAAGPKSAMCGLLPFGQSVLH